MSATAVDPVDEILPLPRLATLGLQHVLVMYAGAIAVPLIVGRALKLTPEQVATLISADLFCCGLATLVQALGVTQWFGVRLPVMMGVTFASVSPMIALANASGGVAGAQVIFGSIIAAGIVSILIAPLVSRLLGLFPPVVTGTIITVIGVTLMRVGISWIMNGPAFLATSVDPAYTKWLDATHAAGTAIPDGLKLLPTLPNPSYAAVDNIGIAAFVLIAILLIARFGRGFLSNIAVLLGLVLGVLLTAVVGKMSFAKVAAAPWLGLVLPFQFGTPVFELVPILTMVLVMIVVMIESTGMFLALGEITGKTIDQRTLAAGLRTDGVGTLIGGIFNTFPYTSFSQNVGLVGVTGIRSRYVCVAGGIILIVLGLIPKLAALVEAVPQFVLGGAGLVMFGMVAATGIRILSAVDFRTTRNNLFVVGIAIGFGMIPLVAERYTQQLPKALEPLLQSGILLTALSAMLLNIYFNGVHSGSREAAIAAAHGAEA
jgi:uracil-xanthine permease